MKTIIDAVNYFRAEWPAYGKETIYENPLLNGYHFGGSVTSDTICTLKEFNNLVTELSNWQPTLPPLPKAETVEYKGMVYEIGKIYEFRDNDIGWYADVLVAVENGTGFPFESVSTANRFCRECQSTLGTITPAPTKLIDGEAYMFDFQGETRMGFKFGEYLRIDKYTKFSIELCTNITHLTAAK